MSEDERGISTRSIVMLVGISTVVAGLATAAAYIHEVLYVYLAIAGAYIYVIGMLFPKSEQAKPKRKASVFRKALKDALNKKPEL